MVLGSGATTSVGGIGALVELARRAAEDSGWPSRADPTARTTYRFGNGEQQTAVARVSVPSEIAGRDGEVSFYVLDAQAPVFLGMDFLRRSRAVIDYGAGTVHFRAYSDRVYELRQLEGGHLAVRITTPVRRSLRRAHSW